MPSGTILSFLTQRHVAQREVVASDGLVFLLQRSQPARSGIARLLGLGRDDFVVEGQVVAEEARPDISLLDPKTRKPLALLELKFWAELTDAQPSDYLQKLKDAGGGPLCFVAPPSRHVALWKELLERADGFAPSRGTGRVARRGRLSLRLISWEELLAPIASAVGGSSMQADLDQLRGLVADFESAKFRPFQSEDISNLEVPRLVMALADLAIDIVHRAESEGTASTKGTYPTHYLYGAGRYLMLMQRAGAWLGVYHKYWADFGLSPLWLEFGEGDWGASRLVRKALPEMFDGAAPTPSSRRPVLLSSRCRFHFRSNVKQRSVMGPTSCARSATDLSLLVFPSRPVHRPRQSR
jgi:hypothetical protein